MTPCASSSRASRTASQWHCTEAKNDPSEPPPLFLVADQWEVAALGRHRAQRAVVGRARIVMALVVVFDGPIADRSPMVAALLCDLHDLVQTGLVALLEPVGDEGLLTLEVACDDFVGAGLAIAELRAPCDRLGSD